MEKMSNKAAWISAVCAIVSIIFTIITIICNIAPQMIPWNSNLTAKAEAGDLESQMLLADHYYEVGDIEESVYWYKIATIGVDRTVASDEKAIQQARALNNLAYIYLTDAMFEDDEINFSVRAYHLLSLAAEMGNLTAVRNQYAFLCAYSTELLKNTYMDIYNKELDIDSALAECASILESYDLLPEGSTYAIWVTSTEVYDSYISELPTSTSKLVYDRVEMDEDGNFKFYYTRYELQTASDMDLKYYFDETGKTID